MKVCHIVVTTLSSELITLFRAALLGAIKVRQQGLPRNHQQEYTPPPNLTLIHGTGCSELMQFAGISRSAPLQPSARKEFAFKRIVMN